MYSTLKKDKMKFFLVTIYLLSVSIVSSQTIGWPQKDIIGLPYVDLIKDYNLKTKSRTPEKSSWIWHHYAYKNNLLQEYNRLEI